MKWFFIGLALLLGPAAMAGDTVSLYQLKAKLETHHKQAANLDLYRGHPTLVTMFYGTCPHVCPMLIASMQNMERQLPAAAKGRLRVLLISLDPVRDSPEQLMVLSQRHRADTTRWTFARASESDVRKIAAALRIRYRQLPDGEFNHSTVVSLLGPDGQILEQTSKLSPPDPLFVEAVKSITNTLPSRSQ